MPKNLEFRIDITRNALADAREHVRLIRDKNQHPKAAQKWFRGLITAIYSLANHPRRCVLVPEAKTFPFELRHLIYYSHRVIFRIDDNSGTITVVRVFHGQRRLRRDDLF